MYREQDKTYNCTLCRNSQKDGFTDVKCQGIEHVEICPVGKVPKLNDENREFQKIFEDIEPGMHNGMGGFDYFAIDMVLRRYDSAARDVIFAKCLVMIRAIMQVRKEKKANSG